MLLPPYYLKSPYYMNILKHRLLRSPLNAFLIHSFITYLQQGELKVVAFEYKIVTQTEHYL